LAENMEYVITPAVVAGAMALLVQTIVTGLFDVGGTFVDGKLTDIAWWNSLPVWMAVFYVIFVWINIVGIEATMRFTVTITVLSIAVLAFFFLATIFSGKFDSSFWTNIPKDWDGESALLAGGGGPFLPFGIAGIFKALPFAIWFFLAIEEVPLAAEESMDPRRDVPKGSVLAMHTLLIAAILTLFLNTGLPEGAGFYGSSAFPLLDGFTAIFGTGKVTYLLGLLFMIGLIASFFTIIFAYGRNTFSLSRAGYFPKFLSVTHGKRKTPHVALIAGAIVGYAVAVLVYILQEKALGAKIVAALLNMAVFAAVISYIFQMTSFVVLRKEAAEHRATVSESLGDPRGGHRGGLGRDRPGRDLLERRVSTRRLWGRDLLRPRGPVLRDRGTEPPRAFTGGGVRAHAGFTRHPGPGGLRDHGRRTGGDPRWWFGERTPAHVTSTDVTAVRVVPTHRGAAGDPPAAPRP
jgi:Amino acid transporters